jgi:hypothetical protein
VSDECRSQRGLNGDDSLCSLSDIAQRNKLEKPERQEARGRKSEGNTEVSEPVPAKVGEKIVETNAVQLTPEDDNRRDKERHTKNDRQDAGPLPISWR